MIELYQEYFLYSDGKIFWRRAPERKPFLLFKEAGQISSTNGRWYIKLKQQNIARSRLVWMLFEGAIPAGFIVDHIDHSITNDKRENLRLATQSQNLASRRVSNNLCGFRGVSFHSKSGLFRARVGDCTKYAKTVEEAAQIYNALALKKFGEFAELNRIP